MTPRAFRQSGISSLHQLLSTVNVLVNQNTQLIKDNSMLLQSVERQSLLLTKLSADFHQLSNKVDSMSVRVNEIPKDGDVRV